MKKSNSIRILAMTSALLALASAAACSGKKTKPEEQANAPAADANLMGDSDSGRAMGLKTVHFDFDSSTLNSEGKSVASADAQILKANPGVKVQVEGHCDQRGGIQYNIALGEKRANAVRDYLADLGIAKDRVTTISYGKERPVDPATTEEAYAKNRRANFVITAK